MTTSFDDYAAQRKTRWSAGQRAAHEVAEQAFGDGTAVSNDVGVNISALLEDDDFVLCIAEHERLSDAARTESQCTSSTEPSPE